MHSCPVGQPVNPRDGAQLDANRTIECKTNACLAKPYMNRTRELVQIVLITEGDFSLESNHQMSTSLLQRNDMNHLIKHLITTGKWLT